ncbi:hypothetical protein ACHAWO_006263 [Cyclotella atomus]|uniref:Integrase catalytic domain-containing protein n=1 Tax=Cyclotella atomus TaxID=382360 RepID=A0ABD3PHZ4_9STRA
MGGSFMVSKAAEKSDRQLVLEDNFIDEVITEIKHLWPDVKMVKGSARHSESNGGVERANHTSKEKLAIWMKMNNSTDWATGSMFVQWQINTSYHHGIQDTPYRLTYGQLPRVGISQSPIDQKVLSALATEAEMNHLFGLGFTVLPTAATADVQDQARVEPTDDVLVLLMILECRYIICLSLVIVSAVSLLTHFFVAAAVEEEQLQPSDPNHPEYGLKPAAILDAVNGNKTTDVGTDTAPFSARMDFDNNGVKPSAVSDKAIDSVDETAAAPFVCTKSNSNDGKVSVNLTHYSFSSTQH